jgi:hypothetical protein
MIPALPLRKLTCNAAVKGGRVTKPKKPVTPKIKSELLEEGIASYKAVVNATAEDDFEDEV